MRNLILLMGLFCGLLPVRAQIKQVSRVEFELNAEGADRTDILGPYGLIVHGRINVKGKGDLWAIRRFNTDLQLIDSTGFAVGEEMNFVDSWLTDDVSFLYFLFIDPGKRAAYKIVRFEAASGKMTIKEGALPRGSYFSRMSVVGETVFIAGTSERKPALFRFDFSSGGFTPVNILPQGKDTRFGMDVPLERPVLMVTDAAGRGKSYSFRVSFFNEKGNVVYQPQRVITQPDYYCRSASLTVQGDDEYILTGTYSQGKAITANGVYFAHYKNNIQSSLKFHSFTGFTNFFEYLNKNRKAKAERKVERKKKQGKDDVIEALVASHPVFVFNDNYMFLGEIYYPTYRTEVHYAPGPNGTMTPQYRQVFDGYQYSHAVVLAMDKEGNKVYDHCFPMWLSYKPFTVRRFIRIVVGSGGVDLFFGNGSKVSCFRISNNNVTERDLGSVESTNEADRVRWTSMTNTSYWYDNYFISYGSQSIKNTEEKGKKRRTVFFVSKMQF